MTEEGFAVFSVGIKYLPSGTAPHWDSGMAKWYFGQLADIPDNAVLALTKAIGSQWKFRPTPKDILDVYQNISAPPPQLAEELAAKMLMLRNKNGRYTRRIEGDPYCRWEFAEPPWTDSRLAAISARMGGWNEFCNEDTELSYLRHYLTKVCAGVLGNATDAALDVLRMEYQQSRPAKPLQIDGVETSPAPEIGRVEAGAIMQNMASALPIRVKSL